MQDAHNTIKQLRCISPVSEAGTTALVGQIIDRANFDSLEYVILTGSLADADATFTVLLEDGDDSGLSDAAAVTDANLLGTEAGAAFDFSNDDEVRKLGYRGDKRYSRLTITPVANASAALLGAVAILSNGRKEQTSQS